MKYEIHILIIRSLNKKKMYKKTINIQEGYQNNLEEIEIFILR